MINRTICQGIFTCYEQEFSLATNNSRSRDADGTFQQHNGGIQYALAGEYTESGPSPVINPVEPGSIRYRNRPKEVKEDVLLSLRRGCGPGLKLL
jgi:hypothetical protein